MPPNTLRDFITNYLMEKKRILASMLSPRYSINNLPERVWEQALLPIRDGGLGYHDAAEVTDCAYVASFIDCKDDLEST